MTMKHIKKPLDEVADKLKKGKSAKNKKPAPVFSKFKSFKSKPRRLTHPMQWFFDNERKELARRQKLNKKEGKSNAGRPTVMDEFVVQKLEQAFSLDATQEEACIYAGISRQTLNTYCKKNPEFLDRIDQLKELPVLMARQTILRKMEYDGDLALKYVKNKRNNEFNERKDLKLSGAVKVLPKLEEEDADKIKNTFNIFLGTVEAIAEVEEDESDDE